MKEFRYLGRGSVCSDADSLPFCCGEERAEPKGKALCLPVDLRHEPQIVTERMKLQIQVAEIRFLCTEVGLPQRQGEKLSLLG